MSIQIESVDLVVSTSDRYAAYTARFSSGLNVIEAPNSWGKSTLIQSIVYGLGLEGSFSASHLSPLGEAMTSVIDLDGHRQAVVESYVTLTLQNDAGHWLRTRRWARSMTRQNHLIQTWQAEEEAGLDGAEPTDLFVREGGGATHELGFHHVLSDFIGWRLPLVPSFAGADAPLYLEVLFPMFYVEQKYGWSGLAPRIPTTFRIRSAYRRAAEYVLGLSSLERLKELDGARQRLAAARSAAEIEQRALDTLLLRNGWRLSEPIDAVLAKSAEAADTLPVPEVRHADDWISVASYSLVLEAERRRLETVPIVAAGTRTAEAQQELRQAEARTVRLAAALRRDQELIGAVEADRDALQARLNDLERDRTRLIDVAKLQRLGSDLEIGSLSAAHCPTCAQSLDATQVATGVVLDVAANTTLLSAERATVDHLLSIEQGRVDELQAAVGRLALGLTGERQRIRSLKDELTSPSDRPSIAQVRERLELDLRISAIEAALVDAAAFIERVVRQLEVVARIERAVRELNRGKDTVEDEHVIAAFAAAFRAALGLFHFSSLPVGELTIGSETLLPEHGGFELTFDINHGLSASDTVRAKWAYYTALARASLRSPTSHHLGMLVMDEPRQQEAQLDSVRALYRDLADLGDEIQVIVASSADRHELDGALVGTSANRIQADTGHLLVQVNAADPRLR